MHGIAEAVAVTQSRPGARAFVGANGGIMSKYSAEIYSAEPRPFAHHSDAAAQDAINAEEKIPTARYSAGEAVVETYTVDREPRGRHGRHRDRAAPDGSRTKPHPAVELNVLVPGGAPRSPRPSPPPRISAARSRRGASPPRQARTHRAPVKTATGTTSRYLNRRTAKPGRVRNHNGRMDRCSANKPRKWTRGGAFGARGC